jgi:hypothetical protein
MKLQHNAQEDFNLAFTIFKEENSDDIHIQ